MTTTQQTLMQRVEIELNNACLAYAMLKGYLSAYDETPQKKGNAGALPLKNKTDFLEFTDKEILKMSQRFRKIFIICGCRVHVRRRSRSAGCGYDYEARYRRDGYNISVSSKNYDDLKELFIKAVNAADDEIKAGQVPNTFNKFAKYFFETFWRRTVAARTYKTEMNRYDNHIAPHFGEMPIKSITPAKCQQLFDKLAAAGKGKTLDEVHGRLNQIFNAAIKHGLIKFNPVDLTIFTAHETEHGKALTKAEERELLAAVTGTPYLLMFAVALYTGLRPNEYATARIDGAFIFAVNSKRKNGKIEYKKIPITPMLRPYLVDVQELRFYVPQRLREKFRAILPGHSLKDMRETFNTRCIECGVDATARQRFMGHSLGALGNAYTDLTDEFLIEQGEKINY